MLEVELNGRVSVESTEDESEGMGGVGRAVSERKTRSIYHIEDEGHKDVPDHLL